jgi:hypothetical protein
VEEHRLLAFYILTAEIKKDVDRAQGSQVHLKRKIETLRPLQTEYGNLSLSNEDNHT